MTTARQRAIAAGQVVALAAVAAVLLPTISPGAAVAGGITVKLLFLARIPVLLVLATWFLRLRGLGWRDVGLRKPRWSRFALALVLGLLATVAVGAATRVLGPRLGLHAADYSMFGPLKGNLPLYLFLLLPVTWGSAALGEELIFRGFILEALEEILGAGRGYLAVAAVVAQAVLFGALHLYQGVGGFVTAGSIGLVLGFVWLFSGRNLWAGIVLHGLADSAAMTTIYLMGPPH
jgi:membrane protease YdiL (CAAX protease family)